MSSRSLYRQYRPRLFSEVVGQEHVVRTLSNAIKHDRLSHAYLFSGPRGTGKTSVARILAMLVNCHVKKDGEPCLECVACRSITSGSAMDILEFDAASRGKVDEIREIIDRISYAPSELEWKIYIIDEAHMLTRNAFDALLKTLEEPPDRTILILCTTEPHRIPLTIRSRCQRFEFKCITTPEISARLKEIAVSEKAELDDAAAMLLAQQGEGSMRDAIGLLERVLATVEGGVGRAEVENILGLSDRQTVQRTAMALVSGDRAEIVKITSDVYEAGRSLGRFVRDLVSLFHTVLIYGIDERLLPDGDRLPEEMGLMNQIGVNMDEQRILNVIMRLTETSTMMKTATQELVILQAGLLSLVGSKTDGTGGVPSLGREAAETSAKKSAASAKTKLVREKLVPESDVSAETEYMPEISDGESPDSPDDAAANSSEQGVEDRLHVRDLTELNSAWQSLIQPLKRVGLHLYTVLCCSEVLFFDGRKIELGFRYQHNLEVASKPENRRELEGLLRRRIDPAIVLEMSLKAEDLPFQPAAEDGPTVSGSEMVHATLELFGGSRVVGK